MMIISAVVLALYIYITFFPADVGNKVAKAVKGYRKEMTNND